MIILITKKEIEMTYVDQLKQMSNEELIAIALSRNSYIPGYRDSIKAELLSRLNRDPMDDNCGNCRYLTFGTSEQGKNVWNCRNKEPLISNFWNFRTSSYDVYVNKTIRCSLWEGGDK